jgi:hypothetical protein
MPAVDYTTVPNDFAIEFHGSVSILKPLTLEAKDWCASHMNGRQSWCSGRCFNLEAFEVKDILSDIEEAGLTVFRPPSH